MDPDGLGVAVELAMIGGGAVAVVCGALSFVLSCLGRSGRRRKFSTARKALTVMLMIGIAGAVPSALSVARRHFGAWREVRDALRTEEARIQAELGDRESLTQEEYERHGAELARRAIQFSLPGTESGVTVEIMRSVPPYVGLDFGGGTHAAYDTRTMFCVYSD